MVEPVTQEDTSELANRKGDSTPSQASCEMKQFEEPFQPIGQEGTVSRFQLRKK